MTIPSLLRKIFYNTSSTPKAAEEQRQDRRVTGHASRATDSAAASTSRTNASSSVRFNPRARCVRS
jgi:hypothetical protein